MIQGYLLSIFYLIFAALLLLQNKYRLQLSFFLKFSSYLKENRRYLNYFSLLGLFITLILVFFPISPGPMVLGDLIPALFILYETLYFFFTYGRDESESGKDYLDMKKEGRRINLGWCSLIIAVIHFIFPSFVLL